MVRDLDFNFFTAPRVTTGPQAPKVSLHRVIEAFGLKHGGFDSKREGPWLGLSA